MKQAKWKKLEKELKGGKNLTSFMAARFNQLIYKISIKIDYKQGNGLSKVKRNSRSKRWL